MDINMMLAYKAWANSRTLAAACALPAEELHRKRATTFDTILRTLNHVWVVDDLFRCHLTGTEHPYTFRNTETEPTIAELADKQASMDQWYQRFAADLSSEDLDRVVEFTFVGGGDGRMTVAEILLHLVDHGTYHRGYVSDMMYQVPVEPPTTDLPVFLRDVWHARHTVKVT